MQIILGSSSPNRAALFDRLGIAYTVEKPDYEEIITQNEPTHEQVMRFAKGKAESIAPRYKGQNDYLILGFDSMISLEGKSIGKAESKAAMIEMIVSFAGKQQEILTGVCVLGTVSGRPVCETFYAKSTAQFRADITPEMLQKYGAFGDWSGKCGAWSVLGTGLMLVEELSGSFQNVVGVPVIPLRKCIERLTGRSIFDVIAPQK